MRLPKGRRETSHFRPHDESILVPITRSHIKECLRNMFAATLNWTLKHDEFFQGDLSLRFLERMSDSIRFHLAFGLRGSDPNGNAYGIDLQSEVFIMCQNLRAFERQLLEQHIENATGRITELADDDHTFCMGLTVHDSGTGTWELTVDCSYPEWSGNEAESGLRTGLQLGSCVQGFSSSGVRILLGGAIVQTESMHGFRQQVAEVIRIWAEP